MIYMKWTPHELATLEMPALYTEVDDDGYVLRELTVAPDGSVAEQLEPTNERPGWFGLTRLVVLESNVTKDEFESLWEAGVGAS